MNRRLLLLLALFLGSLCSLWAGLNPEALGLLKEAERRYGARVGLQLTELSTGRVVLHHRSTELMTPASLVKILSTGSFLQQRGSDFRFETRVYALGEVKRGVLRGDLLLVGSADPSLASRYVPESQLRLQQELLQMLERAGIHRIDGRILIDGSASFAQGQHPSWLVEDTGNYYGAGVYALNYRDNYFDLWVSDSGEGGVVLDAVDPDVSLSFVNELRLSGKDEYLCYGSPHTPQIILSGSIRRGSSGVNMRPAHPEPIAYALQSLRRLLDEGGVPVSELGAVLSLPLDTLGRRPQLLGSYYSLPADTLVRITNHRSANVYAEALGRSLYLEDLGPKSLEHYWLSKLQLPQHSLRLYDSSGLSVKNRITPAALSVVLHDLLAGDAPEQNAFWQSLPRLGQEGTLKSFMRGTPLVARLKSGGMTGVKGYAGYVRYEGRWYALVLLSNDFPSPEVANKVLSDFLHRCFPMPKPRKSKRR